MRNTSAVALILVGLTALYAYNTGRAQAVLAALKGPAPSKPATKLAGSPGGGSGGGGADPQQIASCAAEWQAGVPDVACAETVWKGLNSIDDIKSTLDTITSSIGFKL